MKQIYEDLSDDTDFDIIDLADVPDRDTVKRRKKKSQRDVNKTNKSEEVKLFHRRSFRGFTKGAV